MNLAETENLQQHSRNRYELLLDGLKETEELHYFRFLAKKYKFHVSNDWPKTIKEIHQDLIKPSSIKPDATFRNLELLVDQIIMSADQAYRIYEIDRFTEDQITEALLRFETEFKESELSEIYPSKIKSDSKHDQGTFLTKIKQFKQGVACIYSTILEKTEFDRKTRTTFRVKTHHFSTIFIPFEKKRIEVRIPSKMPKNEQDDCFRSTYNAFYDLVGLQKVNLRNAKEISFIKCIESLYQDKKAGRAAAVIMTTDEQSSDANLSNKTVKNYCARTQVVQDNSGKKHTYICRAVNIRWELPDEKVCEMQVSIEPHKNLWEIKICNSIKIKHPESFYKLDRLITDVISRA
ncbi:hypothetical protein I6F48_16030 [Pseudoalteromonas sp. SWYJ118]|uniref:hypothetical protein n=1 Tax=Pseudoalteromonas sp. SWYJ118 TaxID=2792062 RepID=UPI0018CE26B4|nr:hypothetical protein [Pseudoalteromonas sp. SWYJ118]MBH0077035.1 hypothetical protein [Pseudoalteromonas sp. SWYJ118]